MLEQDEASAAKGIFFFLIYLRDILESEVELGLYWEVSGCYMFVRK